MLEIALVDEKRVQKEDDLDESDRIERAKKTGRWCDIAVRLRFALSSLYLNIGDIVGLVDVGCLHVLHLDCGLSSVLRFRKMSCLSMTVSSACSQTATIHYQAEGSVFHCIALFRVLSLPRCMTIVACPGGDRRRWRRLLMSCRP